MILYLILVLCTTSLTDCAAKTGAAAMQATGPTFYSTDDILKKWGESGSPYYRKLIEAIKKNPIGIIQEQSDSLYRSIIELFGKSQEGRTPLPPLRVGQGLFYQNTAATLLLQRGGPEHLIFYIQPAQGKAPSLIIEKISGDTHNSYRIYFADTPYSLAQWLGMLPVAIKDTFHNTYGVGQKIDERSIESLLTNIGKDHPLTITLFNAAPIAPKKIIAPFNAQAAIKAGDVKQIEAALANNWRPSKADLELARKQLTDLENYEAIVKELST
jgi:hypothetical protein